MISTSATCIATPCKQSFLLKEVKDNCAHRTALQVIEIRLYTVNIYILWKSSNCARGHIKNLSCCHTWNCLLVHSYFGIHHRQWMLYCEDWQNWKCWVDNFGCSSAQSQFLTFWQVSNFHSKLSTLILLGKYCFDKSHSPVYLTNK